MSFVIQNMVNNCELQLILTYPGFFCDGTRRYFLKKALYLLKLSSTEFAF